MVQRKNFFVQPSQCWNCRSESPTRQNLGTYSGRRALDVIGAVRLRRFLTAGIQAVTILIDVRMC